MCVSSNVRCGFCLAKWTGQEWEPSYKSVFQLKFWNLVINQNFELCVEGNCDTDFELSVNLPITDRLDNFLVSSNSSLVKLDGFPDGKNVPDYITEHFSLGFPSNWNELARKWIQEERRLRLGDNSHSSTLSHSFISSRIRRRSLTTRRNSGVRNKEKSIQKDPQETAEVNDQGIDSALPTSEGSSRVLKLKSSKTRATPWLSPFKVQEITKWISSGGVDPEVPDPPFDEEIIPDQGRATDNTDLLNNVSSKKIQQNSDRRLQVIGGQKLTNVVQSTPIRSGHNVEQLPSLNVSSISQVTQSDCSFVSCVPKTSAGGKLETEFRKPVVPQVGEPTKNDKRPAKNSLKLTSKAAQTSTSSELKAANSGVKGRNMNRMLSSTRPRRKLSVQKIERWRPFIGVDGQLKLQGYLLLGRDMTAGQILTTNKVIEWCNGKVRTCDNREYELVGEPHGKMAEELRNILRESITAEEITMILQKNQNLKDDVSGCAYLAPAPAPQTVSMTRSGRVSLPPAPYWLNRSHWGAEYMYFYGDDSIVDPCNSRLSQTPTRSRLNCLQTRRIFKFGESPKNSVICKNVRPSVGNELTRVVNEGTCASKKTVDSESASNNPQLGNSPSQSPVRKSSRITERKSQGKYKSIRRKSRSAACISNFTPEDERMHPSEENENDAHQKNLEKDYDNNVSEDGAHSRLDGENIMSKKSLNQMMLPSLQLASETSIVHFSPTRIKVSYINSPNSTKGSSQNFVPSSSSNQQFVSGFSDASDKQMRPSTSSQKRISVSSSDVLFSSDKQMIPSTSSQKRISMPSSDEFDSYVSLAVTCDTPRYKSPELVVSQPPEDGKTSRKNDRGLEGESYENRAKRRSSKTHIDVNSISNTSALEIGSSKACVGEASVPKQIDTKLSKTPTLETHSSVTKVATKTAVNKPTITETPGTKPTTTKTITTKTPGTKRNKTKRPGTKTRATSTLVTKTPATEALASTITPVTRSNALKMIAKETLGTETPPVRSRATKVFTDSKIVVKSTTRSSNRQRRNSVPDKQLRVLVRRLENENKTREKNKQESSKTLTPKNTTNKTTGKGRLSVKTRRKLHQTTADLKKKQKENGSKATASNKTVPLRKKEKEDPLSGDEENEDDNSSLSSGSSLGPSASVIFEIDSSSSRRAPRTLKERRERDEKIAQMGRCLASRHLDEDPMADLMATRQYRELPHEWCNHEYMLNQVRKRRRPSSSDCTTPPHSSLSDSYGNEDATSSVATPQLLMTPPDPKQIQSYLQRQRALNAKPPRPKRLVKDKDFVLPDIDYAAVFRRESSDSEDSFSDLII